MRTLHRYRVLFLGLLMIIVLFVLVYVYRYSEIRYASEPITTYNVISRLTRMMALPTGSPSIAVVSDANLLKQKGEFFVSAKNGDFVIMYPEKVILFNPSDDKIVNVGTQLVRNLLTPSPSSVVR